MLSFYKDCFILHKILLRALHDIFVRRKSIDLQTCGSPQKSLGPQIANPQITDPQITKKIGSTNTVANPQVLHLRRVRKSNKIIEVRNFAAVRLADRI